MLHITDSRTGAPAALASGRLTRVDAHPRGADVPTAVRILLVADVLARALDIGGAPVRTGLITPDLPAEVRPWAAALGIRPPDAQGDIARVAGELGGGRGVQVCARGGGVDGGVHIEVAGVEWAAADAAVWPDAEPGAGAGAGAGGGPPGASGAASGPASGAASSGPASVSVSASALRLALLAHPRGMPLRLTEEKLAEAAEVLGRWRGSVARWATEPSRPIPDDVRRELRGTWENDLDLPALIETLDRLERGGADDVPRGALFEAFVYADRVLGVELAREIGGPM
ncbi:hypothetical protein [Streptomyces cavernae]|uniref:hypothetical protein n=1 Tax=Streptomyces cavernae TaxID=2259034 RepID=UPI000FEBE6FD|nr:hypothetical protein [Streptomyces cavernae]